MGEGRLKILVSAYACSPIRGSEPGMGWGFVEAISKYHDLSVVTEKEKFEPEIEAELQKQPELRERIKFFYVKKNRHKKMRKIWPPSYYWFYKAWQRKAFKLAQKLQREENFDVVHQLNMVGFREPGYLWKLDVPFVWGPVGGMGVVPWQFLPSMGLYGAIYFFSWNILNWLHMWFLTRPRKAAAKANKGLIAATPDVKKLILEYWKTDSTVICEVGSEGPNVSQPNTRSNGETLHLSWCGLHVPRKALDLLLEALKDLPPAINWHLHVVGGGSCTNRWQRKSRRLKLMEKSTWYGWLQKETAISIMAKSHVCIITSLKDLSSTVTIEAMSNGVPIICLDHCGFSDIVTEDCGIKISVSHPRQVVRDIAAAVERLWHDENYRQSLACGAIKRAADYSWEKKAEDINEVYEHAIRLYDEAKFR